jgi:hypothetical protein
MLVTYTEQSRCDKTNEDMSLTVILYDDRLCRRMQMKYVATPTK